MWLARLIVFFLLVLFVLPALATGAWWSLKSHPASWRDADWSASGVLPAPSATRDAAVYVMAARTGGFKGAFSVHSWIVTKRAGAAGYDRYDKVGWGSPIRRNAYPADGRWYSNDPTIVHAVHGADAERLIPDIEAAIQNYPFARPGDYHIWPGPNSNSFVAHVLRAVPGIGARMPSNATGRDYAPGWASFGWSPAERDFRATLGGLAGFSVGATSGFELQFMGLVAGLDFADPALKIPAFGRVALGSGG